MATKDVEGAQTYLGGIATTAPCGIRIGLCAGHDVRNRPIGKRPFNTICFSRRSPRGSLSSLSARKFHASNPWIRMHLMTYGKVSSSFRTCRRQDAMPVAGQRASRGCLAQHSLYKTCLECRPDISMHRGFAQTYAYGVGAGSGLSCRRRARIALSAATMHFAIVQPVRPTLRAPKTVIVLRVPPTATSWPTRLRPTRNSHGPPQLS